MTTLTDDQGLARYVFHRKSVRSDNSIRLNEFKPRPGETLSLYDVEGLSQPQVCDHGRRHADNADKDRHHVGFGALTSGHLRAQGLVALYDNTPPRHVSVAMPELEETRKRIATALGNCAKFHACE